MIKKFKSKITDLQKQDEVTRFNTATRWVLIIGVLMVLIWLIIILPLQLFMVQKLKSGAAENEPGILPPQLPDLTDIMPTEQTNN